MRRCGDEWSVSRLGQFTSVEISSSVDRLEGWVAPTVWKREKSQLLAEIEP